MGAFECMDLECGYSVMIGTNRGCSGLLEANRGNTWLFGPTGLPVKLGDTRGCPEILGATRGYSGLRTRVLLGDTRGHTGNTRGALGATWCYVLNRAYF